MRSWLGTRSCVEAGGQIDEDERVKSLLAQGLDIAKTRAAHLAKHGKALDDLVDKHLKFEEEDFEGALKSEMKALDKEYNSEDASPIKKLTKTTAQLRGAIASIRKGQQQGAKVAKAISARDLAPAVGQHARFAVAFGGGVEANLAKDGLASWKHGTALKVVRVGLALGFPDGVQS